MASSAVLADTCGVVLEKQTSITNCTSGLSYGCASAQRMYISKGCRGKFRCGPTSYSVSCSNRGSERQTECSCVPCEWRPPSVSSTSADDTPIEGVHCCADNGATLEFGSSWARDVPGNANASTCRAKCTSTHGCSHYVFSDAPEECLDELRGRTPSRCTLCAACTRRHQVPAWEHSFTSYALSERAVTAELELLVPRGTRAARAIPAVIISGCESRYERAAAVARRADLVPNWLPAVFPQNVAADRPECSWPTPAERNLLASHRNAWSFIASTNISMLVLEDDIEIVSSALRVHADVHRCDASPECAILFVGFVDAFWATHALYVTPWGARQLLEKSATRRCPEPADFYTHRLCQASRDSRDLGPSDHRLAPHCFKPASAWRQEQLDGAGLRAPDLYGVGHFVQNRTLGAFIHSQDALTGIFGSGSNMKHSGLHC